MIWRRIKNLWKWSAVNPTRPETREKARILYEQEMEPKPKNPATILEIDNKTLRKLLQEDL